MGSSSPTELDAAFLTSVAPRSPGGSLPELVRHLASAGEPCALGDGGRQAWIESPRHVLFRLPVERLEAVEPGEAAGLLRRRGVRIVNWLRPAAAPAEANCHDYVCRDAGYDLSRLGPNPRRDVRRGLRSFAVRLCTWEEWAEQGLAAHAETERRHGNPEPGPGDFRRLAGRWRGTPFLEIWGAWRDGGLAAWMTVLKVEDWALVDLVRSRSAALRLCPNNAVLFAVTWSVLRAERRRLLSYGTSSLQVGADEESLHRYKVGMGFEALPVTRVFACRPAVRLLLESPVLARILGHLAAALPRSPSVRKLAGVARLLSGRATGTAGGAGRP